jgi:arylsulfatase A-like enzyme
MEDEMKTIAKPNILLLHSDQHHASCLGVYGNKDIRTPHLDALAADGVVFENSFCPYPICTPSRYSMITGLYVHQHLGRGNSSTLPNGIETFPRILQEAGYKTKAIGKMHFTPMYLDVGFDELELAEKARPKGTSNRDSSYYGYLQNKGIRLKGQEDLWGFGAEKSAVGEEDHITTWTADRAMEALEQWGDGGQFLMVGFNRPHRPFDPPAPWDRMYDPEQLTPLPGWTDTCLEHDLQRGDGNFPYDELTMDVLKKTMAYYYGCISQIDHQIGRLIQRLKEKGLYENTLIIYTSDHGEYMGYHHLMGKINYLYDAIVKTPLIIKFPGLRDKGQRSQAMVNNIDLAPTILTVAGCEPGKFMNGLRLGDHGKQRKLIFAERGRGNEYMVRSGTRKLIYCKDRGKSLYFDLENDPWELHNLFLDPAYQEEIKEYIGHLTQWVLFDAPTPVHVDESAKTTP